MTLDNQLWEVAGMRPSLDLRFSDTLSTTDVTTGTNPVDFTRASGGTYVGSDGLIKNNSVVNLLLQSEDFSTTWTKGTNTTITTEYGMAPNGTMTADRVQMPSDIQTFVVQSVTTIVGQSYVFSIYARATSGSSKVVFDLGPGPQPFTLGEAWQRYSVSFTAVSESTSVTIDNGAAAIDVLVWGAQLEQSDTVGEYVRTTSSISGAPRFDHDPETGESLGLLIEEQRTNLLPRSEYLPDYNLSHVTVPLDSSAINPTGSTGSYKILADSGTPTAGIRIRRATSSGNNIVVSAFVKKSTHRYVYVGFGGISNSFTALFDIEPGLTSDRLLGQDGAGTFTNIAAGYEDFPNDWIRIWAAGTTSGVDGPTIGMGPDATTFNITNWTTAGTEEIYAWGLQYEDNASFPTSYIPTTAGAAVTRSADVASITGANFSRWYSQSEGTVFTGFQALQNNGAAIWSFYTNPGGSIRQMIDTNSQTRLLVESPIGSYVVATYSGDTAAINTFAKSVATFKTNDYGIALNGGTVKTDTSGTMPTLDRLNFGVSTGGLNQYSGTISRLTYWPARINNFTLQELTTEQIMAATFNPKGANYTTNIDTLYTSSTGDDTAATYIPYSPGTTLTELSPRAVKVDESGTPW